MAQNDSSKQHDLHLCRQFVLPWQLTSSPSHSPLDLHARMAFPFKTYPLLQTNRIMFGYVVLFPYFRPFFGLERGPQSLAGNKKYTENYNCRIQMRNFIGFHEMKQGIDIYLAPRTCNEGSHHKCSHTCGMI